MEEKEQVTWGMSEIRFSDEQAKRIFDLLDCNGDDLVKVFEIAPGDELLAPLCSNPMFLGTINRILSFKRCFGRTWDYVLMCMEVTNPNNPKSPLYAKLSSKLQFGAVVR